MMKPLSTMNMKGGDGGGGYPTTPTRQQHMRMEKENSNPVLRSPLNVDGRLVLEPDTPLHSLSWLMPSTAIDSPVFINTGTGGRFQHHHLLSTTGSASDKRFHYQVRLQSPFERQRRGSILAAAAAASADASVSPTSISAGAAAAAVVSSLALPPNGGDDCSGDVEPRVDVNDRTSKVDGDIDGQGSTTMVMDKSAAVASGRTSRLPRFTAELSVVHQVDNDKDDNAGASRNQHHHSRVRYSTITQLDIEPATVVAHKLFGLLKQNMDVETDVTGIYKLSLSFQVIAASDTLPSSSAPVTIVGRKRARDNETEEEEVDNDGDDGDDDDDDDDGENEAGVGETSVVRVLHLPNLSTTPAKLTPSPVAAAAVRKAKSRARQAASALAKKPPAQSKAGTAAAAVAAAAAAKKKKKSQTKKSKKPKTIHTCDYCKRDFNRLSNLRAHERTHTGDSPFVCHCGKAFKQNSNLKRHMKVHGMPVNMKRRSRSGTAKPKKAAAAATTTKRRKLAATKYTPSSDASSLSSSSPSSSSSSASAPLPSLVLEVAETHDNDDDGPVIVSANARKKPTKTDVDDYNEDDELEVKDDDQSESESDDDDDEL